MKRRNKPAVLIIADFGLSGGTRSYFKSLIEFCTSRGYGISVALRKDQRDNGIIALMEKHAINIQTIGHRASFFFWRHFPFNLLYDWVLLAPLLLRVRPSLLIVSNGTPGDWLGGLFLVKRFIYVLHSYPSGLLGGSILGIPYSRILRIVLSNKKKMVTVSEYSKKAIIQFFLRGKGSPHVHAIYNYPENGDLPALPRVISREITIFTLGHVEYWKNPALWIEIAREVIRRVKGKEKIVFIWAGNGRDLASCAQSVANEPQIQFIGYQINTDKYLANADIYFQPSMIESHGIGVIEAMRYGIPCVVSNAGGLPESVVNGETGRIVDVNDRTGMTDALVELIGDKRMRTAMGRAGYERYMQLFTREQ